MNPRPAVVGLGESLLRLSTPGHGRLERMEALDVHVGGAEMNSLIGVAALGGRATWVTRLADNPLGRRIANHAAAYGVDLVVDWDLGARAPLYFVEHGVPPRPSEVLYDRGGTAMSRLQPQHFDWAALTAGCDAAYTTGITCALGEGASRAATAFLDTAHRAGRHTAFDLNYRSRLWGWPEAAECLRTLLPSLSVLFASAHDLRQLFDAPDADPVDLARDTCTRYGVQVVVVRTTTSLSGRGVRTQIVAVTPRQVVRGGEHEAYAVDAFGAGDAAAAAFLTFWLRDQDLVAACDVAAWACAFQHTIGGDAWQVRRSDVDGRTAATRRILR